MSCNIFKPHKWSEWEKNSNYTIGYWTEDIFGFDTYVYSKYKFCQVCGKVKFKKVKFRV